MLYDGMPCDPFQGATRPSMLGILPFAKSSANHNVNWQMTTRPFKDLRHVIKSLLLLVLLLPLLILKLGDKFGPAFWYLAYFFVS